MPMSEQPEVDVRLISPGYLSALHIPVLRGRDINDTDVAGRPAAILISESMARQFWPGEDPLGKRLTMTFFPDAVREVVGVVGDVKIDSLDQTRPSPTLYFPLDQVSVPSNGGWSSFPMTLVVRSGSFLWAWFLRSRTPCTKSIARFRCATSYRWTTSSPTRYRSSASTCCCWAPSPDSPCCWPRWAFTACCRTV